MKASLILCEHAALHNEDGTVSMIKAGIRRWPADDPKLGARLRLMIVSVVEIELGDQGAHGFDVQVISDHGKPVLPKLAGNFVAPPTEGFMNLLLTLDATFPIGQSLFVLRIDNHICARWDLTIVHRELSSDQEPASKDP